MAIINYNSTKIENTILPSLFTSVTSLANAYKICSQLSIPNAFEYKTQLKCLDEELKTRYDKLNNIYNKIKTSSNMFKTSESQFQNNINNINNPKISLRKSVIK